MLFTHDTNESLVMAAALVNTDLDGIDDLETIDGLDAFLLNHPMSGGRRHNATEVAEVRQMRGQLARIWQAADADAAVGLVNSILTDTDARPYLTRHDGYDWHLHMTTAEQPLAMRMGAEVAMAFADLIRAAEFDRLRHCAADDCEAVLVDLSKNRSRRYCDTGNCANRAHVAAYRARRRSGEVDRTARSTRRAAGGSEDPGSETR